MTLEILNRAEQVDTFSASGWKLRFREFTRYSERLQAAGAAFTPTCCSQAVVLLPGQPFPGLGIRPRLRSGEVPATSCPDTRTHRSHSQREHTVFKMRALRTGLFGK